MTAFPTLFHIVDPAAWSAAARQGEYRAASLATEGFIHCSFAEQVARVANDLYADAGDVSVVELDPAGIPCPIVVEDSYGIGTVFPHIYGPVPTDAAVAIHSLPRGPDGRFLFSRGGEAASA